MSQLTVLYQNKDILAVNKPAGISVHNNEDAENLLKLAQAQFGITQLLPVHRLDKETSGIQILALTSKAAQSFAKEFENRNVRKIYTGLLRGQLKTKSGVWNRPLTDKAEGRKNPEGMARDRVPCETHFKVLQENAYFSYCEFELITGRQHQIRKHAAVANHHLVGDPRYGDAKYNKKMFDIYKTDRMFLHCSRIEIRDIVLQNVPPSFFHNLVK